MPGLSQGPAAIPVVEGAYVVSEHRVTVYVGNLPWTTTEDDLASLFGQFGPVVDARIIQDRMTGRSRGYGFVEMAGGDCVSDACAKLNGYVLQGRALLVSLARPKPLRQ
jgi:RNA recognition motif-containing protein